MLDNFACFKNLLSADFFQKKKCLRNTIRVSNNQDQAPDLGPIACNSYQQTTIERKQFKPDVFKSDKTHVGNYSYKEISFFS